MADRLEELERHVVWLDEAIEASEPKELAALLRERRITLSEIAALGGVEKGSVIDELSRRREDRQSASDVAPKPRRGRQ